MVFRRNAPPFRQLVHQNPEYWTTDFMNPFLRTEHLPPIQLSIAIRSVNWRMYMARKEFTAEEIAILKTSPHGMNVFPALITSNHVNEC